MSKGVQIAVGATLIAALMGWYGATNLDANASFTYYQSLEDFHAADASRARDQARVHGYVVNDSIRRDVGAKVVRFAVQNTPPHAGGNRGTLLEVVLATLETPDLFKDGAEVVVEGRLVDVPSGPEFRADKVLAKCPSKFEAKAVESASF